MSELYTIKKETMTNIADSIRELTGTTGSLNATKIAASLEQQASSGGIAGGGIIDVTELPTENIKENVFYRLLIGKFVWNRETFDDWICYYVNELPDIGEPVSTDMENITAYYNATDGEVYGYADSVISTVGGIPVGWYPIGGLGQAFNVEWGGVITDINDDPADGATRLLLGYDFYTYKNEWTKIIFALEKDPAFDIQWDGDMTDKFVLDMTALGFENTYFVKVSDLIITQDKALGCIIKQRYAEGGSDLHTVIENDLDTTTYAGAISINSEIVSVYSEDDLNTALGLPTGYLTNGTYFVYIPDSIYISRFTSPPRIIKIDSKYIDLNADDLGLDRVAFSGDYYDLNNAPALHTVATSGSYNDLWNKPVIYTDVVRFGTSQSLTSSGKQTARNNIDVYSKSEVDDLFARGVDLSNYATKEYVNELIGNAIGGSY